MDREERERLRASYRNDGNMLKVLDALDACERERDEARAERTRYVLADAGWKETNRQLGPLREDARALAQALNEYIRVSSDALRADGELQRVLDAAVAALACPGVRRLLEEK